MKRKVWELTVLDNPNRAVAGENDIFYTTDTEAFLIFRLTDSDIEPTTADLTLVNTTDKSVINETVPVIDNEIEWEMNEEAIAHSGNWQGQLVYMQEKDGQPERYTAPVIQFNVQSHLMTGREPSLVAVNDWTAFMATARDVLNQLECGYLKKIKHRIKVVDVGGNIGNHTIFFSKVCGADVVSFEPQKNCFETLKLNCELNSVNCECFNVAIGEDNRKVAIDQFDSLNLGGNSFSYSDICDGDNIVCRSLDSFSFEYIDFIKIDVEGFEIEVLKNSINTIQRHKPLIFIEVFPDNFSKVMNIMEDLNYSIIREFPYFNYLFCHGDSVFSKV